MFKMKLMLIACFDVRGMVHFEFLPQRQTVNQHINRDPATLVSLGEEKQATFAGKQLMTDSLR